MLLLSYFVAQNSIWITAFGWMATYVVGRGITGPQDYLLIAILPAWSTFLGLVSQPLYAPITDVAGSRWGRRRFYIVIGGLFAAIWFVFIPWFANYLWVFVIFGLCALSINLAEVSYLAFFRDKVTLRSRGIISGGMVALSFLGTIPLVVGLIGFDILGLPEFLSLPFLLAGLFTAFWSIPIIFLREMPMKKSTSIKERFRITVEGFREVRHNIDFQRICIVRLLHAIAVGIVVPFALLYLEQEIGIPTDIGGLVNGLVLLLPFILCLPLGIYADRRGRRPVLGVGSVSLLISMLLLFINGITLRSFPIAMAGFGFMGISMTTFDFITRIYVADISPQGKEALYFATSNFFNTIPFPMGIFFGGLTSEIYQSLRYLPLLVMVVAILLIILTVIMRETLKPKPPKNPG
jgi:MFS family permease